ncbi:MAG: hypothetical protein K2O11_09020, partial [Oscillospiraceae bacterium]|nr:hypothetical protein [Oscillospiraceae bacterium]
PALVDGKKAVPPELGAGVILVPAAVFHAIRSLFIDSDILSYHSPQGNATRFFGSFVGTAKLSL